MALRVLVRGVGDIGSAVAHQLFHAGHVVVVLHDGEQPTTTRRGMAFADWTKSKRFAWMSWRVCLQSLPGLSPLTIGLGPIFVAGEATDVVVETSRERLGRVMTRGTAGVGGRGLGLAHRRLANVRVPDEEHGWYPQGRNLEKVRSCRFRIGGTAGRSACVSLAAKNRSPGAQTTVGSTSISR